MKHISILVPAGDSILDTIIGSYGLLRMANAHYKRAKNLKEDYFHIDLVGLSPEPVSYRGLFQVTPTKTIHDIEKTDLIVVAAISGNLEKELINNAPYIDWIKKQRIEQGADIASLCKGAFLLAETTLHVV